MPILIPIPRRKPKRPKIQREKPVDIHEAFERLMTAYSSYYDLNREDPLEPFDAEAVFRLHDEQYILVKKAKVSEVDSYEFVYFAKAEELSEDQFLEYENAAWEDGLSRANPKENHRNSDVTVVITAESISPEAEQAIKKSKKYKSYKWGIHGWSAHRVVAYDLARHKLLYNRRGEELKEIFSNIF